MVMKRHQRQVNSKRLFTSGKWRSKRATLRTINAKSSGLLSRLLQRFISQTDPTPFGQYHREIGNKHHLSAFPGLFFLIYAPNILLKDTHDCMNSETAKILLIFQHLASANNTKQMFIILQIQSRSLIKISSLKEYSQLMPCCRLLQLDMSIILKKAWKIKQKVHGPHCSLEQQ